MKTEKRLQFALTSELLEHRSAELVLQAVRPKTLVAHVQFLKLMSRSPWCRGVLQTRRRPVTHSYRRHHLTLTLTQSARGAQVDCENQKSHRLDRRQVLASYPFVAKLNQNQPRKKGPSLRRAETRRIWARLRSAWGCFHLLGYICPRVSHRRQDSGGKVPGPHRRSFRRSARTTPSPILERPGEGLPGASLLAGGARKCRLFQRAGAHSGIGFACSESTGGRH